MPITKHKKEKAVRGEMHGAIALEDGSIFSGSGFASEGKALGEAVFNTSMQGYQEALTDPSYKGQILVLTYPVIGNYGVNREDAESRRIQVEGFVVKELVEKYSHCEGEKKLEDFLKEYDIPCVAGIDTRALTLKLRSFGTMRAAICVSSKKIDEKALIEQAKNSPDISTFDLVKKVTIKKPEVYNEKGSPSIALLDCGTKRSIIRNFASRGAKVIVLPADYNYKEILNLNVKGLVVSNGPGDPKRATYAIETIKRIKDELPILGICLGHQLLALAFNGDTYKLKFGHRGSNQPVKDFQKDRVYITAQNHGFAVDVESISKEFELTQINLNDKTCEGMRHKELPISSIQYHPEASPGPEDAEYIFDEFLKSISSKGGK